jgi:hypothetical protein
MASGEVRRKPISGPDAHVHVTVARFDERAFQAEELAISAPQPPWP